MDGALGHDVAGALRVSDASAPAISDMSDGGVLGDEPPVGAHQRVLPHPYNASRTTTPDYDQQFVEAPFNAGTDAVDLSGWQVNDNTSYSGPGPHAAVFPAGTWLEPRKAYVVYSGTRPSPLERRTWTWPTGKTAGNPTGLRFNRGKNQGSTGDTVYLQRADGTIVDSHSYLDTYPGISWQQQPGHDPYGALRAA